MTYEPRRYWNERARAQGPRYVAHTDDAHPEATAARWAALVEPLLGHADALLDFGCGVGRFARYLAPHADLYVGTDIVAGALAQAPRPSNGVYVHLPTDVLPFPSATFDLVVAITVLQHIAGEFDGWTAELRRVLRPDGRVVIVDHVPLAKPAEHMHPRGPNAVAAALGIRWRTVRKYESHWLGVGSP